MKFNYSKLKGKIVEKYGTQAAFCNAMGMSERTLTLKLNNRVDWKQSEIIKACELLDIPPNEVNDYFFSIKVQQH